MRLDNCGTWNDYKRSLGCVSKFHAYQVWSGTVSLNMSYTIHTIVRKGQLLQKKWPVPYTQKNFPHHLHHLLFGLWVDRQCIDSKPRQSLHLVQSRKEKKVLDRLYSGVLQGCFEHGRYDFFLLMGNIRTKSEFQCSDISCEDGLFDENFKEVILICMAANSTKLDVIGNNNGFERF